MTPLYEDPWYTFRFIDDRSIPRFHLEGVEAGRQVSLFKIASQTGERLGLLATGIVGDGGWVNLAEPIIMKAGEAFIAVLEPAARAEEGRRMLNEINSGRYRHYKGNEYSVVGVARHSETLEELVVYRQEHGERGLWVRPKQMFLEPVKVGSVETPRFRPVEFEATGERPNVKNLFADVPKQLPSELFTTLLEAANVRIERIMSHGHASPDGFWYDQSQHEWVIVLQGAAKLRFEDEIVAMNPGDAVNIPAHRKHRVEWTTPEEPTIWLAVHYDLQK